MSNIIFYHTDNDGYLSGIITHNFLSDPKCKMIPINYNHSFPWELINKDTDVYMVDFSLPWEEMIRLKDMSNDFIWIDHHKTVIKNYNSWLSNNNDPIKGLRIDGVAACRLCWEYFFPNIPEPLVVYLAGMYDVFMFEDKAIPSKETFRPIPGIEDYEASTYGRIKLSGGDIIPYKEETNRFLVTIKSVGIISIYEVDYLICKTFLINETQSHEVVHKNGNTKDNNIKNLQWFCSDKEYIHKTIFDPGILNFMYGTWIYKTDPVTTEGKQFWNNLLENENDIQKVINQGEIIKSFKNIDSKKFVKSNCFECSIDGLKVVAVNRKDNSKIFDSVFDPAKHDAMMTFYYGKGVWNISLYSNKENINVSSIAKKYKGRGHKGTAEFHCKEIEIGKEFLIK
jgi:hypothetical protein